MTVTKTLGEQSGIQYQGVQDKSEADPRDTLINTYFAGQFKHGPFNKPFKVTRENIRAKLGYDPDNLVYQAIEDCLAQGVPFVWVMRTAKAKASCQPGVIKIDPSKFNWDPTKDLVAYAKLTVNGVVKAGKATITSKQIIDFHYNQPPEGFSTNESILNKIFFYSGVDLFRQTLDVWNYFRGASCINRYDGQPGWEMDYGNYLPLPDRLFYYEGVSSDTSINTASSESGYYWEKANVMLELLPAPNLASNEQDIILELFGPKGVSAHSCAIRIMTAT